ncbi:hypothetical protein [Rothia kristinae]|uniref:hypothetical protein n=1 Tax=Rothia kristinae TaxID=37923 RepID=UPI0024483157|nr:hypothetical protein [Rothia kristinae]WGH10257.1 hypothetical protein OU799_05005 [Rothia kristinae]
MNNDAPAADRPTPEQSTAPVLRLADPRQARDLATLISRARALDEGAAVRLQAVGSVLAVWVPVMSGETLLEQVPTVLGMRAVHLSEPSRADATVQAAAVLDRMARVDRAGAALALPPITVRAAWSGAIPGTSGWKECGTVSAQRLEELARQGSRAVEQALPAQAGAAVLSTVRSRIWGTVGQPGGFVAGAAFGAKALGFLGGGDVVVHAQGPWRRLSNRAGHLLARPAASL